MENIPCVNKSIQQKNDLFQSFHPNRHFNPIHTFRELHSTSFENCPISLRVSPAPNISQTATKGTPTRYGHGRPPASWALLVGDQTSKRWKVQLGTEVTQGTKSSFHTSSALVPSNPEKPMFKRFLFKKWLFADKNTKGLLFLMLVQVTHPGENAHE